MILVQAIQYVLLKAHYEHVSSQASQLPVDSLKNVPKEHELTQVPNSSLLRSEDSKQERQMLGFSSVQDLHGKSHEDSSWSPPSTQSI